jgi:hypothetical protein
MPYGARNTPRNSRKHERRQIRGQNRLRVDMQAIEDATVGGSYELVWVSKAANYTLVDTVDGVHYTADGYTLTLDAPSNTRVRYFIADAASGVTISPPSGTIDGGASVAVPIAGGLKRCAIMSDGTNFFTFGRENF